MLPWDCWSTYRTAGSTVKNSTSYEMSFPGLNPEHPRHPANASEMTKCIEARGTQGQIWTSSFLMAGMCKTWFKQLVHLNGACLENKLSSEDVHQQSCWSSLKSSVYNSQQRKKRDETIDGNCSHLTSNPQCFGRFTAGHGFGQTFLQWIGGPGRGSPSVFEEQVVSSCHTWP